MLGRDARLVHGGDEELGAADQARPDQRLQLAACDDDLLERLRHQHLDLGHLGEVLLGQPQFLAQAEAGAMVVHGDRAQQPLPARRVLVRDRAADVLEQRLVDVETTDVAEAAVGQDAVLRVEHGDVERVGAEVVDGERAATSERRDRDGLGNRHELTGHAREPGRGQQLVAPGRAPFGGVGQADLVERGATEQRRDGFHHARVDGRERVVDRQVRLGELDRRLVDVTFRVRLVARRVLTRPPVRFSADEQGAVLVEVDGRGHGGPSVQVHHTVVGQHRNRVGGAQVDGQDAHRAPLAGRTAVIVPQRPSAGARTCTIRNCRTRLS